MTGRHFKRPILELYLQKNVGWGQTHTHGPAAQCQEHWYHFIAWFITVINRLKSSNSFRRKPSRGKRKITPDFYPLWVRLHNNTDQSIIFLASHEVGKKQLGCQFRQLRISTLGGQLWKSPPCTRWGPACGHRAPSPRAQPRCHPAWAHPGAQGQPALLSVNTSGANTAQEIPSNNDLTK